MNVCCRQYVVSGVIEDTFESESAVRFCVKFIVPLLRKLHMSSGAARDCL